MAALVAYMSAVYMRDHGVEVKACYAIRASHCAFHHRTLLWSWKIARRPEYRSVGSRRSGDLSVFTFDCQRFEWPDCVSGEHNLGRTCGGGTGRHDARGNRGRGAAFVALFMLGIVSTIFI